MLCGNCCALELQTNNIEWGSGVLFHRLLCGKKKIVLVGALEVLLKDNVSTNYVADCSYMPDINKMAGTGLILPYPFGYGAVAV